jgi:alkanesulfonate monooxygenase SsuD/methylene tetrahydromethanopterin reductase-like flavin-dependent oxidoreductase (luciferase family)
MRHGLFFPAFDVLSDARLVADVAREAEDAGWDGVFLWDHLLYAAPVEQIADPWITLTAVALATSRIEIGLMVTPLSRRRPAIVARQAVTIDRISNGRLILGFGLGDDGQVREMSALGEEPDPRARAARLDEGLDVLTRLLSGEAVAHAGTHYTADGVRFRPTAARPGGIPIWLAARYPNRAPMRRAARYDGLFTIELTEPAQVTAVRETLAAERGDLTGFDVVCQGQAGIDPRPWDDAGATWWLTQCGPYRMDIGEVRRVVSAGPPVNGAKP